MESKVAWSQSDSESWCPQEDTDKHVVARQPALNFKVEASTMSRCVLQAPLHGQRPTRTKPPRAITLQSMTSPPSPPVPTPFSVPDPPPHPIYAPVAAPSPATRTVLHQR
jgi:hypothetical protein